MFPICSLIKHEHGLICPRECTHAAISERIGLVFKQWSSLLSGTSVYIKGPALTNTPPLAASLFWINAVKPQLALPFLPSLHISLCLNPLSKLLHLIAANAAFLNYHINLFFINSVVTNSVSCLHSKAFINHTAECSNTLTSNSQNHKSKSLFIVTSPQHKCLGEWNSYERAPDSAKKKNNNLHMDSTYLQTVQKTMCKIHIHIFSTHSVL